MLRRTSFLAKEFVAKSSSVSKLSSSSPLARSTVRTSLAANMNSIPTAFQQTAGMSTNVTSNIVSIANESSSLANATSVQSSSRGMVAVADDDGDAEDETKVASSIWVPQP